MEFGDEECEGVAMRLGSSSMVRLFSRREFYRLLDQGFFHNQSVELIEGEIIRMPEQQPPHSASIGLAEEALRLAFGQGFWVRSQAPMHLLKRSAPAPDISVVPGSPRDYRQHPTSALLVVEVSDSTLSYDRGPKASLYAKAKIADYWIVNLVNRQLEVRRRPVRDRSQLYSYRYADLAVFKPTDHATPLAVPQARIPVADLLP
jgi:Uma2 family endonuclease